MSTVTHARCECDKARAVCGTALLGDEQDTDFHDCAMCAAMLAEGTFCAKCDGALGNVDLETIVYVCNGCES